MKNNYETYILYGLLILVAGLLFFSFKGFFVQAVPQTVNTQSAPMENAQSFTSINSGTTDPGDVSIELTPIGVNNGKLEVKLSSNTHSVDMDQFDLMDLTTLEYEGKSIKPISVPTLSGHHVSGTLKFDIGNEITAFTIKIAGIPKVEERIFTWE